MCQWLFARLHPNFGIWLASSLSGYSRSSTGDKDRVFLGEDKEWLIIWCKEQLMREHYDYFIFGHRHYPLQIDLGSGSTYINLGEWMSEPHYAVFDGNACELKKLTAPAR
jgi:UDP-2,3-diacylglucosamine hydrolase